MPGSPDGSALRVEPGSFRYAYTIIGTVTGQRFNITNRGSDILIGTVESRGDFQIVSNATYVLPPGQSLDLIVEFAPQKPGEHSGSLVFHGEHSAIAILDGAAITPPPIVRPPPAVLPEITALGGGTSFQLGWPSEQGREYQVWYSDDLNRWTRAGEPILATGARTSFSDDGSVIPLPPVAAQARFYRVGDSGGIVGFRRVSLTDSDTPLSVPFLKTIVAQGTIDGVNTCSIADTGAAFRPGQFRFDPASAAETYALTVTSGSQTGHWFIITGNDAQTITVEDVEGNCLLLQPGDRYIVHPLQRIRDVFGGAAMPSLDPGDQIFVWDVISQNYETAIGLGITPDHQPAWVQGTEPVDNVPLLPGEGVLVKREGTGRRELLLLGAVPPAPVLQQVSPGNNLVGQPWPAPLRLAGSDLLASGFTGAPSFSSADRLYLLDTKRGAFKTVLWFNSALARWLSPDGNIRPMQLELLPCSAFFIQRNRLSGFEWVQMPVVP